MPDYSLAQCSVLGSMLIDPRTVGDVMTDLRPEDFSDGIGRDAFLAIRDLYLSDEKIDPVTVLHRMGQPTPEQRKFLLDVMDNTPTASNVAEWVQIVLEQSRLRDIQNIGLQLATTGATMEQARELVAQLDLLMVGRPEIECLSMEQGLLNFYSDLERTPQYLPWGINFLDEGLTAEAGDYIVLGGYPSDGKTALALSMAYHQAGSLRVGFFSLETKPSKLFNRVFSSAAQVSGPRIKRRKLTDDDFGRLESKAEEIRARDLYMIRSSSMTVEDIASYTRAKRFDVIYIDYLTLIQAPGRTEFDQATYISKALHRLAQDTGVTVIALSQLSRPESGKVKPPTLASLRSSGQIEQDADIVLFVYREEPGKLRSRRILAVAKNKEGETGRIPLLFNGETQTFRVDTNTVIKSIRPEPKGQQMSWEDLTDKMDSKFPFERQ